MKFGKRETQPKEKKPKIYKVNTRKGVVIALWSLYAFGFGFAVYKNFTAIDTHTIRETTVIEERFVDTYSIESFVTNFAKTYYAWEQTEDSIGNRERILGFYMTAELQRLNADMIRRDIPVASAVENIQIWSITPKESEDTKEFDVIFTVSQRISEGETAKTVTSIYEVTVYLDEDGDMVITKNPTISQKSSKSAFEPQKLEVNGSVDMNTADELNEFLETFFTLYPTATEKELSYYVSNNALKPVGREYLFAELVSPIYVMQDEKITAHVSVQYLDEQTNMTLLSQFQLILEKADANWKIVG